jgi:hypothetical protein
LTEPRPQPDFDQSDDSHSSISFDDNATDHDDGINDANAFGWGEEQARRQSVVVQQRIARCQSAISKHQMTIGMLQYNYAQDRQSAATDAQPLDLTGYSSDNSIGVVSDDDGLPSQSTVVGRRSASRIRGTVAPAIVQDSVARLTRRCLETLGSDRFQAAKMHLQALLDDSLSPAEMARNQMLELLGFEFIGFYSLIDQIVYMERKWGTQDVT